MIVPGVVVRIVGGVGMRSEISGCIHMRKLTLNIRAKFSSEKQQF